MGGILASHLDFKCLLGFLPFKPCSLPPPAPPPTREVGVPQKRERLLRCGRGTQTVNAGQMAESQASPDGETEAQGGEGICSKLHNWF